MNRASTRHVGLGIAGALVTSTRDVARLSLWAAKAGLRTPLAAPLRSPARRLVGDAEHRGALNEARLLSDARHISAECFARVIRGPLLDYVVSTLVEAGALERVRKSTAQQGAGTRTEGPVADAMRSSDSASTLHVTEQPADKPPTEATLRHVSVIARNDEVRDALTRQTDRLVDDAGDRSRDGTAAVNDRMAGLAQLRLHGQANAALLAGFENGAAPA